MIALVDGDVMCYRIAFACKDESEGTAITTMAAFLEEILMVDLGLDSWQIFLTGKDNFRKEIAVTAPYKGNRTQEKPAHLEILRNYLVTSWGAIVSNGEEADDCIAIKATELKDDCIIVSIDKDFLQVAGWHYNFVKKEKRYVSEAEGIRFFYKQILMGDRSDNIVGIKGVGPAKAEKMLAKATTEPEMLAVCLEALGNERTLENGRLLWLRRQHQQLWEFPQASNLQAVHGV
jgi:5'-3' exonuclease